MATGALANKPRIISEYPIYSPLFKMVATVHQRATLKYPWYSWINTPGQSDALYDDCINALMRHLAAHSMGYEEDPEGCPHVYHIAARASMLLCVHYQGTGNKPIPYTAPDIDHLHLPDTFDTSLFQCFPFLPGIVLKMHKLHKYDPTNSGQYLPTISGLLNNIIGQPRPMSHSVECSDINDISTTELLCWYCFLFALSHYTELKE